MHQQTLLIARCIKEASAIQRKPEREQRSPTLISDSQMHKRSVSPKEHLDLAPQRARRSPTLISLNKIPGSGFAIVCFRKSFSNTVLFEDAPHPFINNTSVGVSQLQLGDHPLEIFLTKYWDLSSPLFRVGLKMSQTCPTLPLHNHSCHIVASLFNFVKM